MMQDLQPRRIARGRYAGYALLLAATVGAYLWIRARGEGLEAPPARAPGPEYAGSAHSSAMAHVLLALAMITLVARFCGGVFRRYLHQPAVIGEIFAGLALGPSLLGGLFPEAYAFLLPTEIAPTLGVVSKVGVVLFMFLVGLDLDTRLLRGNTRATIAISHASICAPFLLGSALALGLYARYSTADVSFTVFSLFLGVSMSVTAFPVLARILSDRRAQHTRLGAMALGCAAAGDVTAWTLLAFVAGVATAEVEGAAWTAVYVALYVAAMFFVARPLLKPFVDSQQGKPGPLSHSALAAVLVALLLSAFATELIGIHGLFGAFLLGAILPHDGRLAEQIRARLEDFTTVLFLPVFFAFSGMRTQLGLLGGAQDWIVCGLVLVVATLGKFGGTYVAARITGIARRQSAALGVLMNTRGLMELVVLNLGLDLGVISPTVFTMLVIMALVTTIATTPALTWILGRQGFADALPAREETARRAKT